MGFLNWVGEHPILTVVILLILVGCLPRIKIARGPKEWVEKEMSDDDKF
jgi:hypothetical protein